MFKVSACELKGYHKTTLIVWRAQVSKLLFEQDRSIEGKKRDKSSFITKTIIWNLYARAPLLYSSVFRLKWKVAKSDGIIIYITKIYR